MSIEKFIKSKDELQEIAELFHDLARQRPTSVYRYKQIVYDSSYIDRGDA